MPQENGTHARPVASKKLLLRNISVLETLNEEVGELRDAAVFVEGNVIRWVGTTAQLPRELGEAADEAIDMQGRVVTPGLVNTHHHMFQTLTRCIAQVPLTIDC